MSTINETCTNRATCDGTACFGCRIREKFLYILSLDDVTNIYKHVSKRVTFVQTIDGQFVMDYMSITLMARKFNMDAIIKGTCIEDTFAEFLSNRLKPYYRLYAYVTGSISDNVDIYAPPYEIDFRVYNKF